LRKVRPIETGRLDLEKSEAHRTESVDLEKSEPMEKERVDLEKNEAHGDRKSGS
jgi:hypothetical protein